MSLHQLYIPSTILVGVVVKDCTGDQSMVFRVCLSHYPSPDLHYLYKANSIPSQKVIIVYCKMQIKAYRVAMREKKRYFCEVTIRPQQMLSHNWLYL